jgi:hypothetical protein
MSSSYSVPTGRDLAIEALLDREPHGDYYRVARLVVRLNRLLPTVQCISTSVDPSTIPCRVFGFFVGSTSTLRSFLFVVVRWSTFGE